MGTVDLDAARRRYREREAQQRARREAEREQWLQRVRQAVLRIAPHYPEVQRVYAFGSLVKPGRFGSDSDIDIAVACDAVETESAFWRALERELERDVDLRPLSGDLAEVVHSEGEKPYGREDTSSGE